MRLFHKIFLCFVFIFSITFQVTGVLLVNFAYENALEQEKKYAFQEFQYNKYILQSLLYSKPERLYEDNGELADLAESFSVPIVLYGEAGGLIFSNMTMESDMPETVTEEENQIAYQIRQEQGEGRIFAYQCVVQGETKVYLGTETDISAVIRRQRDMSAYFQRLYLIILCIGFPVSFFLTEMLTRHIKSVRRAARRIAEGSFSERIPVSGRDEIAGLAVDFNQMAEKVEEKISELSDTARQKEEFAANFAHELKTPLTSVIGYADMLYQRELPREQVKSAAEYIWNEGMRLEALALKLMDLFVLDKQDFTLEEMSVQEMFEHLLPGLTPVCDKYGMELHLELEEGTVRGDFDLLKTMLLNLADNAGKADSRDLWIQGRKLPRGYQLGVRDNGKGIPPEEIGRITEAFYMVDKSRARKQHGAGLGMTLVAKISELHKADMKITSDGKAGTEITFTFDSREEGADE